MTHILARLTLMVIMVVSLLPERSSWAQSGPDAAGGQGVEPTEAATTEPSTLTTKSESPDDDAELRVVESGVVPTIVSIVPGVLVHGAGTWAAGDETTGYELLAAEGIGIGLIGGSLGAIAVTGASRKLITPLYMTTLTGVGLFLTSWLADIYGASTGEHPLGVPRLELPWIEASLGYGYIDNHLFSYGSFAVPQVSLRLGSWSIEPSAWIAMDDDNQLARLEVGYRFWGPSPTTPSASGSSLDLVLDGGWHRFGTEGLSQLTLAASVEGRLDMGSWSKSLRGSYWLMEVGVGLELWGYEHLDVPFGEDSYTVLLYRFGYGLYLGSPGGLHGEVEVYYDHRHDDWAAGSGFGSIGDGIPGHIGLAGWLYIADGWGVSLRAEAGSVYLATIAVTYQLGGGTK